MFSSSTVLRVYIAPRDRYTYENLRNYFFKYKYKWSVANPFGAEEVKVLENNKRHTSNFSRPYEIFGTFKKQKESLYVDTVGDIFEDYNTKFKRNNLSWFGTSGKFDKKTSLKKKKTSIPNARMFDVSINFDSNSIMEKIYMDDVDFESALKSDFRTKLKLTPYMEDILQFNLAQGMEHEEAVKNAIELSTIIFRNLIANKNNPKKNWYAYLLNYYNRFIDPKIREMMPIDINVYFLKEAMDMIPNLSLYVIGLENRLLRIHGISESFEKNVIVALKPNNGDGKNRDYVYSFSPDHFVFTVDGVKRAGELKPRGEKIKGFVNPNRALEVEHRGRLELMYSLILEGSDEHLSFFDSIGILHIHQNSLDGKNLVI